MEGLETLENSRVVVGCAMIEMRSEQKGWEKEGIGMKSTAATTGTVDGAAEDRRQKEKEMKMGL